MVQKKIGPWTVTGERTAFENPWIRIEDHKVIHPNGADGEYGVVRFKNLAVGVLPVEADGSVWLVGQHRYPLDIYSWELPEGGGKKTDDPLTSAQRELEEEVGLKARHWRQFSSFATSNSVTDERAIAFFAWDFEKGEVNPDPSEALSLKRVKFAALLEMVMDGEISDAFTIIMTLTAHQLALRGDAPPTISEHLLAGRAFR